MRVPVAVSQLCELLYTCYLLLPLTYPSLDLGETFWRTFNISRYLSVCLSVCLSVRFFVGATGHSFGAILTLNGSNDVISQPLVPFGGQVNIAPPLRELNPPKTQFWGVNRRFQAKRAKYRKFHVIGTTASISTNFCTTIGPRDHQEVVVGGHNRWPINPRWRTAAILKKKLLNRHISATVWPILIRFGAVKHIGLLQRIYS